MKIDDMDLYEVNEAFAPVPLAWLRHTGELMATLIHALTARGERYGLQTMCEGGGMANVTIVEAL
jgi:acetyl-CoA C-acetyltransferase